MGRLKPLLPYGSNSVIGSVVRSLLACPVRPVIVVLGHRAAEIEAHLAGEDVLCVRNPAYESGMLSSVRAGIAAAPPAANWLLIALGDQPAVSPAAIGALLTAARSGSRGIVLPCREGRRGHPLLINGRYRDEILGLPDEGGLRQLLRAHEGEIAEVAVDDGAVLRDVDTLEDYARELALLARARTEEC
jgi:CTP:molybdopterin cytidylyltransferase MocA